MNTSYEPSAYLQGLLFKENQYFYAKHICYFNVRDGGVRNFDSYVRKGAIWIQKYMLKNIFYGDFLMKTKVFFWPICYSNHGFQE